MTYDEALRALYKRASRGMTLGLDTMRTACARLGNPERRLKIVHIAGTNGKGSVAAMVEAIARADGLRTGLYTSPHLTQFRERIALNGIAMDADALGRILETVLSKNPDLSFFESATLAAFVAFEQSGVDLAVVEVGLGGRLDATNVVEAPAVCAITGIALDHTDLLGTTIAEIAREKAGIAKAGVPLLLGRMDLAARASIEERANAVHAPTAYVPDDAGAQAFVKSKPIGLRGKHQLDNAAIAYAITTRLGVSSMAQEVGVASVRWPGRLESIETDAGSYLLDAAHNPDGALTLGRHLAARRANTTFTLVFGALSGKSWGEMLDAIAPLTPHRLYVPLSIGQSGGRTGVDPHDFSGRHPGEPVQSLEAALTLAHERKSPLVVVCGSIYLVGEARAKILHLPLDPLVAL